MEENALGFGHEFELSVQSKQRKQTARTRP